jgi:hypothetical protein
LLSGACAGDYTVEVIDGQGCTGEYDFSICCCDRDNRVGSDCEPGDYQIPYNYNFEITEPNPSNNFQGFINLNMPSDSYFSYDWSSPNYPDFEAHTPSISQLSPGTYCVNIKYSCGSIHNYCVTLNPFIEKTFIKNSCQGGSNGSVRFLDFSSFLEYPLTISWGVNSSQSVGEDEGQTIINQLSPGNYQFSITDTTNFQFTIDVSIESSTHPNAYDWPLKQMLQKSPFDIINPCVDELILYNPYTWYIKPPKIEWHPYANAHENPNNSSTSANLTIEWPGNDVSYVVFNSDATYSITGEDEYEASEGEQVVTHITDSNTGCAISHCTKFGRPHDYVGSAYAQNIIIPGTNVSVFAYTGCYACNKASCGKCTGTPGCEEWSEPETFSYIPTNQQFPCSGGGELVATCGELYEKIPIEAGLGQEFIDYENPIDECTYSYGCLFPDPPALPIFYAGHPLYVRGTITKPDCIPGNGGGEPTGCVDNDCDDVIYAIVFGQTCFGSITCTENGETCFRVLNELINECKRVGAENTCKIITRCSFEGSNITMFTETLDISCNDPSLADMPHCDYARTTERFDEINSELSIFSLSDIRVHPNPFNNALWISFNSQSDGLSNLEITNMLGQVVFSTEAKTDKGSNLYEVVLDSQVNGFYMVKLTRPDRTKSVAKIVKSSF